MTVSKSPSSSRERGEPLRERVLDAAERLLRSGEAGFSMRDLAAEAAVSFATPFNQFGGKGAIMHALSARRIATMTERFAAAPQPGSVAARVRLAVRIAVDVMLAEPEANRAVMAWIGMSAPSPGDVLARSMALWALAVGEGDHHVEPRASPPREELPRQLAVAFRGALSFWTAGELSDGDLGSEALSLADALVAAGAARSSAP